MTSRSLCLIRYPLNSYLRNDDNDIVVFLFWQILTIWKLEGRKLEIKWRFESWQFSEIVPLTTFSYLLPRLSVAGSWKLIILLNWRTVISTGFISSLLSVSSVTKSSIPVTDSFKSVTVDSVVSPILLFTWNKLFQGLKGETG